MPTARDRNDVARIDEVLDCWFGPIADDGTVRPEYRKRWFARDDAFDRELKERFGDLTEQAERGHLAPWKETLRGTLALVIVCDQLMRNIWRNTAKAYALDPEARGLVLAMLAREDDRALANVERAFLYMPLMHAEDAALQDRSVQCFEALVEEAGPAAKPMFEDFAHHARQHRDVIMRFGRFPYRNRVLGRQSHSDEIEFLARSTPS